VQLSDHDIVQPDLVVVLAEHSERITPTKLNGPPDLIVEILSPSTARSLLSGCRPPREL
jgi:Uma2 family endonuclease